MIEMDKPAKLKAAQKKVDEAASGVVVAEKVLRSAESERDKVVEAQAKPEGLAYAVRAFQRSQLKIRKEGFAKKQEIAKLLAEAM
jgi:hypothetical protein